MNTSEERLNAFLRQVDDYLQSNHVEKIKISEEAESAEQFSLDEIRALSQDDCFNYAYALLQYASSINYEKERQKIALNWCNDSLNTIIACEIDSFSPYTKHDIKIASIITSNSLASKINEWKMVAESRILMLDNREFIIRKQADCLMEKGKRK